MDWQEKYDRSKALAHQARHDFQHRVVVERDELYAKVKALASFINAPDRFHEVPEAEQKRLTKQFYFMTEYLAVISDRIAEFR